MRARKISIIFGVLILSAMIGASTPLICWKIGWDLQWHRAICWSTEFTTKGELQPTENPTDAVIEPEPTIEPTATATLEPYPAMTVEPYPVIEVWGGIEPVKGWWQ